MKFYLFGKVDSGQPRVLARYKTDPGAPSVVAWEGCKVRAWWLVECESAEAGRAIIAGRRHVPGNPPIHGACDCGEPDARLDDLTTSHLEGCSSYGRILASGGAA